MPVGAAIRSLINQYAGRAWAAPGAPAAWPPGPSSTGSALPDRIGAAGSGGDESRQRLRQALDCVRREVDPLTYLAFELHVLRCAPASEVCRRLGISEHVLQATTWRLTQMLDRKVNAMRP
jgi:hypothetical protein